MQQSSYPEYVSFSQFLATYVSFSQFLATYVSFSQFLATYVSFSQFLATFESWKFITIHIHKNIPLDPDLIWLTPHCPKLLL